MAEPDEVRKAMAVALACYPHVALSEQTVEIWCRLFAEIPAKALEAAVLDYISRAHEFFPAPGVIREKALEFLEPWGELTAPEAWAEVRRKMSSVGAYGEPDFTTPVIEQAVEAVGGWRYLCMSEDIVPDRARFLQAFETIQKRQRDDKWMLPEVKELVELAAGEKAKELHE